MRRAGRAARNGRYVLVPSAAGVGEVDNEGGSGLGHPEGAPGHAECLVVDGGCALDVGSVAVGGQGGVEGDVLLGAAGVDDAGHPSSGVPDEGDVGRPERDGRVLVSVEEVGGPEVVVSLL